MEMATRGSEYHIYEFRVARCLVRQSTKHLEYPKPDLSISLHLPLLVETFDKAADGEFCPVDRKGSIRSLLGVVMEIDYC